MNAYAKMTSVDQLTMTNKKQKMITAAIYKDKQNRILNKVKPYCKDFAPPPVQIKEVQQIKRLSI